MLKCGTQVTRGMGMKSPMVAGFNRGDGAKMTGHRVMGQRRVGPPQCGVSLAVV